MEQTVATLYLDFAHRGFIHTFSINKMKHWIDWARDNPGLLRRQGGDPLLGPWKTDDDHREQCIKLWRTTSKWNGLYFTSDAPGLIWVFVDGKKEAYYHPAFCRPGTQLTVCLCAEQGVWAFRHHNTDTYGYLLHRVPAYTHLSQTFVPLDQKRIRR